MRGIAEICKRLDKVDERLTNLEKVGLSGPSRLSAQDLGSRHGLVLPLDAIEDFDQLEVKLAAEEQSTLRKDVVSLFI